jgi:murein DD-endopeptidase MepM/ murein hydrolase activator NlpD
LDIEELLTNSGFSESLIKINALEQNKFKEWIFTPGMLFSSMYKWWNGGEREKPHEGLDLCFYADEEQRISRLQVNTKIPALLNGVVAAVIDDFLGKSVIIKHNIPACYETVFCSIFGHVITEKKINAGTVVKQGEVIASLVSTERSKAKVFPHLHISLGYIKEDIQFNKLNWTIISDPEIFSLVDPINITESKYHIMDYNKIKMLVDI